MTKTKSTKKKLPTSAKLKLVISVILYIPVAISVLLVAAISYLFVMLSGAGWFYFIIFSNIAPILSALIIGIVSFLVSFYFRKAVSAEYPDYDFKLFNRVVARTIFYVVISVVTISVVWAIFASSSKPQL